MTVIRASLLSITSLIAALFFVLPCYAQPAEELALDTDNSESVENTSEQETDNSTDNTEDLAAIPASIDIAPSMTDVLPAPQSMLTKEEVAACEEAIIYPNAIMRRAETAYTKRRYESVIETLKPVYENLHCVDSPDTIIEIYLLLGVSHMELGNPEMSDNLFLDVLRTDPDYDPVGAIIILPGSSTDRIEKLREEHADELDLLRPDKSHATAIETLFVPGEVEQRPYWLNFVPFGAGLFQMHQTGWGVIYASTQLAGIVMSIAGGGMVEHYRGENYKFSATNYPTAKNWQTVQIIGISLLITSYAANVIHALVIHEPAQINWQSPTKTPPTTHAAAPFVFSDGAGIAYKTVF